MARYIDADKVLDAMMFEMAGTGHQARAMGVIRYAETADVVPKSEVEKIFEEIEDNSIIQCLFNSKPMVTINLDTYTELKKKYTESEGKT